MGAQTLLANFAQAGTSGQRECRVDNGDSAVAEGEWAVTVE